MLGRYQTRPEILQRLRAPSREEEHSESGKPRSAEYSQPAGTGAPLGDTTATEYGVEGVGSEGPSRMVRPNVLRAKNSTLTKSDSCSANHVGNQSLRTMRA